MIKKPSIWVPNHDAAPPRNSARTRTARTPPTTIFCRVGEYVPWSGTFLRDWYRLVVGHVGHSSGELNQIDGANPASRPESRLQRLRKEVVDPGELARPGSSTTADARPVGPAATVTPADLFLTRITRRLPWDTILRRMFHPGRQVMAIGLGQHCRAPRPPASVPQPIFHGHAGGRELAVHVLVTNPIVVRVHTPPPVGISCRSWHP